MAICFHRVGKKGQLRPLFLLPCDFGLLIAAEMSTFRTPALGVAGGGGVSNAQATSDSGSVASTLLLSGVPSECVCQLSDIGSFVQWREHNGHDYPYDYPGIGKCTSPNLDIRDAKGRRHNTLGPRVVRG